MQTKKVNLHTKTKSTCRRNKRSPADEKHSTYRLKKAHADENSINMWMKRTFTYSRKHKSPAYEQTVNMHTNGTVTYIRKTR